MSIQKRSRDPIAAALDILARAAQQQPDAVKAKLWQLAQNDGRLGGLLLNGVGLSLAELYHVLQAAHQPCLVVGKPVLLRGIPFSELSAGGNTIRLSLIPDFLRDESGVPVELNFSEAGYVVTALNNGVSYGDGTHRAITQAVKLGEFRNGSLVLARRSDLQKIAKELRAGSDIGGMQAIIRGNKDNGSCVSCSVSPNEPSSVYHVGVDGSSEGVGDMNGDRRSRVILLRGHYTYREGVFCG